MQDTPQVISAEKQTTAEDYSDKTTNFALMKEQNAHSSHPSSLAVVGGGAAGYFLAVCAKELCHSIDVMIFEGGSRVLRKVRVSGGGRCNVTNTFENVTDLRQVYPRGHRLMKKLFNDFGPRDAFEWFERHGVQLTVQDDCCVFPASQQSGEIIDCLEHLAQRYGVKVKLGHPVRHLSELSGFDFVAIVTGGCTNETWLHTLADEAGVKAVHPVPSLFSLSIENESLRSLMGCVVENASVRLSGTKFAATGALLVTHWGLSGPAILRLSSHAAPFLFEQAYHTSLAVAWMGEANEQEVLAMLNDMRQKHADKQVQNTPPEAFTKRLWIYLTERAQTGISTLRWNALAPKAINRLVNTLCNDTYTTSGRAPFKDEFVTCGGIALESLHSSTLESKNRPHVFFAGEVLDVDGVTGGFNFQAAWTTAHAVARAIAKEVCSGEA